MLRSFSRRVAAATASGDTIVDPIGALRPHDARAPAPSVHPGRRSRARSPHPDRLALERAGWATTLEYRENHDRDDDGRLVRVAVEWFAVAERRDGAAPREVVATAARPGSAWVRLRTELERATREHDRLAPR